MSTTRPTDRPTNFQKERISANSPAAPRVAGPIANAVRVENERRTQILHRAVEGVRPLIDLLTARKAEKANVALNLDPPPPGGHVVTGRLLCASLHKNPANIVTCYEVSIEPSGKINLCFPHAGELARDENPADRWSENFSADGLFKAVHDVELALALRNAPGPTPFRL